MKLVCVSFACCVCFLLAIITFLLLHLLLKVKEQDNCSSDLPCTCSSYSLATFPPRTSF